MQAQLAQVGAFTLIPIAAALLGGILAAFRPPGAMMRSYIQHFAAGVVFASVAGEVLPDIERQSVVAPLIGFAVGVPLVLAIRWLGTALARRRQCGQGQEGAGEEGPTPLIVTAAADLLLDGLAVGVGFLVGGNTGLLLAVALTLEIFFIGLAVAAALSKAQAARWQVIGTPVGLGVLFAIGAVAGAALLSGASPLIRAIALAIGLVVFLYLAAEELLAEAHKVPETTWGTVTFFAGFLALLVVEMLSR